MSKKNNDVDQKTIDKVVAMVDQLVAPAMQKIIDSLNKKLEKENLQVGFEFNWFLTKGENDESCGE